MPTAASDIGLKFGTGLTFRSERSRMVRVVKRRVFRSLRSTDTWRRAAVLPSSMPPPAETALPASMLRRVDFGLGPEDKTVVTEFVPAPQDDDEFSW